MSNKLFLNQIEQYPQLLDELNSLLVQGAEAAIENEIAAKRVKRCLVIFIVNQNSI